MSAARKQAEALAARIAQLLRVAPGDDDAEALTLLIDQALCEAAQKQVSRVAGVPLHALRCWFDAAFGDVVPQHDVSAA